LLLSRIGIRKLPEEGRPWKEKFKNIALPKRPSA
jgi:hypothetical protein